MLLLGASLSSVHQILGRTVKAGQTHATNPAFRKPLYPVPRSLWCGPGSRGPARPVAYAVSVHPDPLVKGALVAPADLPAPSTESPSPSVTLLEPQGRAPHSVDPLGTR